MKQREVSRIGRSSLEQALDDELAQALEADAQNTKNYHIRSARQLCVIMEARKEAARPQTETHCRG
jgi:hypothetical protein